MSFLQKTYKTQVPLSSQNCLKEEVSKRIDASVIQLLTVSVLYSAKLTDAGVDRLV